MYIIIVIYKLIILFLTVFLFFVSFYLQDLSWISKIIYIEHRTVASLLKMCCRPQFKNCSYAKIGCKNGMLPPEHCICIRSLNCNSILFVQQFFCIKPKSCSLVIRKSLSCSFQKLFQQLLYLNSYSHIRQEIFVHINHYAQSTKKKEENNASSLMKHFFQDYCNKTSSFNKMISK